MIEYYNNNNDIVYNIIKYLLENDIIQIKFNLLKNFSLKTILNILNQKKINKTKIHKLIKMHFCICCSTPIIPIFFPIFYTNFIIYS